MNKEYDKAVQLHSSSLSKEVMNEATISLKDRQKSPVRLKTVAAFFFNKKPMKKTRKAKLTELREGKPTLNNGQPAEWLVAAVGRDVADAAVLFAAGAIEMAGVTLRLGEAERRAA